MVKIIVNVSDVINCGSIASLSKIMPTLTVSQYCHFVSNIHILYMDQLY